MFYIIHSVDFLLCTTKYSNFNTCFYIDDLTHIDGDDNIHRVAAFTIQLSELSKNVKRLSRVLDLIYQILKTEDSEIFFD